MRGRLAKGRRLKLWRAGLCRLVFQRFVRSWEQRRTTGSTFRALLTQLGRRQTRQRRTRTLFGMTEKCQSAFERLKKALVSAPVLGYPTREGKFVLDTDASATAIGAVLSQIQDGEEKVIAYASCALSSSRQNYCTTYRELYAVVRFVKYFSHYLWGRPFLVRSDRSSLKWLKNFKQPDGMVARWIATLDTYDFQSEHRKGASHGNADGLSRIPRRCCQRTECGQCARL